MSLNTIPAMTDPLGRHWRQPYNIRQAPMDDTHVLLTPAQVNELMEYSSTYPSGTYDGKCWKAEQDNELYLCWYHPSPNPGKIGIDYRLILEVKNEQ